MSKIIIKDTTVVRDYSKRGTDLVQGKYYSVLEAINVDDLINDCHISPDLEGYCFGDEDSLTGFEFLIIEAFDKTYVTISGLGDVPDIVYKSIDGMVYTATGSNCLSIDLSGGYYYVGDEFTEVAQEEAYESEQSWLWSSLDINPTIKVLGISEATMRKLLEVRKDDIARIFKEESK